MKPSLLEWTRGPSKQDFLGVAFQAKLKALTAAQAGPVTIVALFREALPDCALIPAADGRVVFSPGCSYKQFAKLVGIRPDRLQRAISNPGNKADGWQAGTIAAFLGSTVHPNDPGFEQAAGDSATWVLPQLTRHAPYVQLLQDSNRWEYIPGPHCTVSSFCKWMGIRGANHMSEKGSHAGWQRNTSTLHHIISCDQDFQAVLEDFEWIVNTAETWQQQTDVAAIHRIDEIYLIA